MSGADDIDGWGCSIVEGWLVCFFSPETFWKSIVIGSCPFLTHQSVAAEVVILH